MSKNRYKSVLRFRRLDGTEKKNQNGTSTKKNKLEVLNSTLDHLSVGCTENYSESSNLTADEG
jgi:hypothetical protein